MATLKKGKATSTITETREPQQNGVPRLDGALEDIITSCLTLAVHMCALTAAFLTLVFYYQVPTPTDGSNSAYYVNYSATRLITVSSWTSTAASLIAPFAMALLSYPIARFYQRISFAGTDRSRLPTPYQLGLIIGMLGGGISFVWQNIKYSSWKGRPRRAGVLNAATAGVVFFLLLTFGILAADTWLHVTTSTIPYGVLEASERVDTQYGRGLNGTCFVALAPDYPYPSAPCIQSVAGQTAFGRDSGMVNAYKAFQTLANVSTQDQVRMSNIEGLNVAHLIDASSGFDMDYEASTFALVTECRPITRYCDLQNGLWCDEPQGVCAGALAETTEMTYSCPGNPGLSGNLLNSSGTAMNTYGSSYGLGSNIGFFLQFFNDSEWQIIHSTIYQNYSNALHFITGAYLVVNDSMSTDPDVLLNDYGDASGIIFGCTATGYDLDFKYVNGSVSSGTLTKANDTVITSIGFAMSRASSRQGFQPYLENGMLTGAAEAGTAQEMADYFARTYSQVAVGITSTIMSPRATIQQQRRQNTLVARLPKAPFFTLLVLNVLYALCGLVLGVWALCSSPRTTRDVQARLSIAGLVANLLEPEGRSVKGEGIGGLFSERHRPSPSSENRVAIRQVDRGRWAFQIVPMETILENKTGGEDPVIAEPEEGIAGNGHHYPLLSLTARSRPDGIDEDGNDRSRDKNQVGLMDRDGHDFHSQSTPLMQRTDRMNAAVDSTSVLSARISRKPVARSST